MFVAAIAYIYINFQKLESLFNTFENKLDSIAQNINNEQNNKSIFTHGRDLLYFDTFIKSAVTQPLCEVGFKGVRELAFDNNSSKDIDAFIDNFRQTINQPR